MKYLINVFLPKQGRKATRKDMSTMKAKKDITIR